MHASRVVWGEKGIMMLTKDICDQAFDRQLGKDLAFLKSKVPDVDHRLVIRNLLED
jgi:hypothetical protein